MQNGLGWNQWGKRREGSAKGPGGPNEEEEDSRSVSAMTPHYHNNRSYDGRSFKHQAS